MEDDWDLHAVVRGCCNGSTAVSATSGPSSTAAVDTDLFHVLPALHGSSDLLEEKISSFQELHDLYRPFFPKTEPLLVSSVSALGGISSSKDTVLLNQPPPQPKPSSVSQAPPRSKRRKNQFKKVCQVPAESLSSDIWAWRKYGQKPIKGSPYPRGYYRCSSSKGCLARKQVERNRSDPGMFIVTYTAEHNHPAPTHRNSLAGSTRQKPATPPAAAGSGGTVPAASSPSGGKVPSASSPATSVEEEEAVPHSTSRGEHDDSMDDEEDDTDVALSDMAMNDDFFVGLDGLLDGDSNEDCFLDRFPANFGLSWSSGSAAAAAGGS